MGQAAKIPEQSNDIPTFVPASKHREGDNSRDCVRETGLVPALAVS